MPELSAWANFYVIVGSSAGALIGLQFVVITLISNTPLRDDAARAGEAFGTPTIVHFGAVLLLAAIVSAPWKSIAPVAFLWGLMGVAGFIYSVIVARRMGMQTAYKPELEDWIFHVLLPLAAYGILSASGLRERYPAHKPMFGVAAAALLLLFVGIHNAWDAVTYHVFVHGQKPLE